MRKLMYGFAALTGVALATMLLVPQAASWATMVGLAGALATAAAKVAADLRHPFPGLESAREEARARMDASR